MAPATLKRKRGGAGPSQPRDEPPNASSSSSRKVHNAPKLNSRSKASRGQKRGREEDELKQLEEDCEALLPSDHLTRFDQLPLSSRTQLGLKRAHFIEMTDIQAKSLPLALKGRDILGAARTGSGKTLAFLIPVLERLHRAKWGPSDGLGALVISPTRELAIQIFEVLRKVGGAHTFSAGLVIGGKDLKQEKDRLSRMNILVATPGRLLQHMDQTLGFETSSLQLLVLDEADRILDMGFANTLDAIVENLPKGRRQTLLFSATQTKRVKDLARLSLRDPEYVAVRDAAADGAADGEMSVDTPQTLSQHYMVVPLEKKLSLLYSFIRTHVKHKVLVFLSSCRQVQFVHETFCKLRPGVSLLCLHGKQKQTKRLQIFTSFTRTQHAVLIATDIAARGLDFPAVDWVVQVDAPEDAETYVHRVGRTARYQSSGNALLFLLPSEEQGMLEKLKSKRIAVDKIKARESKTQDISNQLQSFLFQDPQLKYLGQKAFVSYVRSIHLQRDKSTFDVTALPLEAFASALGLPGAPKVKFVKEAQAAKKKAQKMLEKEQRKAAALAAAGVGQPVAPSAEGDGHAQKAGRKSSEGTEAVAVEGALAKVRTKYDRMFERRNQGVLSEHYAKLVAEDRDSGESDESGESDGGEADEAEAASRARGQPDAPDSDESEDEGNESDDDVDARESRGAAFVHRSMASDADSDSDSSRDSNSTPEDEEKRAARASGSSRADAAAARTKGHGRDVQNDDDDDDFLTLKRVDHQLSEDEGANASPVGDGGGAVVGGAFAGGSKASTTLRATERLTQAMRDSEQLSKRKLQQGASKKAMAKAGRRGTGEKLVFDDAGEAHAVYELADEAAFRSAGTAEEQARRFVEQEAERLRRSDVEDRERARERRREKKRREKERERAERRRAAGLGSDDDDEGDVGGAVATLEPAEDWDDGYESPDIPLSDVESDTRDGADGRLQDSEDDDRPRPQKRSKRGGAGRHEQPAAHTNSRSIEEQEALALRLLGAG